MGRARQVQGAASRSFLATRGAALSALGCAVAAWFAQWRLSVSGRGTLFPLVVGLCLAAAVTARIATLRTASRSPRGRGAEALAVLGLLVLGTAWRLLRFDSFPPGLNHDAAWNGMYAIHILQGAPYTPYVSAAWGRETLFMYLAAPWVHWLGNTPEALQAAATVCGLAALLPVWWLTRVLFGRGPALFALGLLAVSGWHLVFSRVGWRCVALPPFAAVAAAALWAGVRSGRVRWWILTGAAAAGAIYTYNAGRVVPLALVPMAAIALVGRARLWKRALVGSVLGTLVFLVTGGPMLRYAWENWEKFSSRAEHLLVEREQRGGLTASLAATPRLFNVAGNGNDFFVREPLLEPVAGVLFLLGTFFVLLSPWRLAGWFAVAGLLAGLLPGVVTVPNGNRCVGALPFVYALAGVGAGALMGCLRVLAGERLRSGTVVLAAACLLVAGAAYESYRDYLDGTPRPMIGFDAAATGAGRYLRQHIGKRHVYVVAESWPEYTLTYLSYPGTGSPFEPQFLRGHAFADIEPRINRHGTRDLVFLLDEKDAGRDALRRLRRMFPSHTVEEVRAPRNGNAVVAHALLVSRGNAAGPLAWENASRVAEIRANTTVVRCFELPEKSASWAGRVDWTAPAPDTRARIEWVSECGEEGERPLLALEIGEGRLRLIAGSEREGSLAEADTPNLGHWYDTRLSVDRSGAVQLAIDGREVFTGSLASGAGTDPPTGVRLRAEGGTLFADNLVVLLGAAEPTDVRWTSLAEGGAGVALAETFERQENGPLSEPWVVRSGLAVVRDGPEPPRKAAEHGANAFDGVAGDGPGEMREPMGVDFAPDGSFYVADRRRHVVQKYAADGSFLQAFGGPGDEPGRLREPHDVAADEAFVYVADTWHHLVQVFDHEGRFAFQFPKDPPLASPRGIGAREGRVCVVDSGHGQVRLYERSGKMLWVAGRPGRGEAGSLQDPVDCAIDSTGKVYVVNPGNNRIEVFGGAGRPQPPIPVSGWTGGVLRESYLAIGEDDTLYLTDWDVRRLRRFSSSGQELPPIGPPANQPTGVAIRDGRALYAARGEHTVLAVELAGAGR